MPPVYLPELVDTISRVSAELHAVDVDEAGPYAREAAHGDWLVREGIGVEDFGETVEAVVREYVSLRNAAPAIRAVFVAGFEIGWALRRDHETYTADQEEADA